MPADTKARYYTWYMTDVAEERTVAFEWWPSEEFVSSMSYGTLYIKERESPGHVWSPNKRVAESLPWVVAQSTVRRQGFNVEVANV
jgi:hypothetical protein